MVITNWLAALRGGAYAFCENRRIRRLQALPRQGLSRTRSRSFRPPVVVGPLLCAETLEDRTLLSTVEFSSTVQDTDEDTHTTPGYFTVTRSGDTSSSIFVNYTVTGGSAQENTDYFELPGWVEIEAKESSAKIEIYAYQDLNESEGDETVELTLQGDGFGGKFYTLGSNVVESLTIGDGAAPPPTISITASDPNASEYASGGKTDWGAFKITLSRVMASDVNVSYNLSGTATEGTDYESIGSVSIKAGNTDVTVDVKPIADATGGEGTETVKFTIQDTGDYDPDDKGSMHATVNITDNNPVTDIALDNNDVDENEPTGTLVGNLTADDEDLKSTGKITYTLVSGDTSYFKISDDQLQTNAVLDYETKNSFKITIRATDDGELYRDEEFTITVNNVNDAPVIDNQSFTISRSHTGFIANLVATDQDAGQTLTFAITAGGPVPFSVSTSGVLEVCDPTTLQALTTNTGYGFTVTVTDNGSPVLDDTASITINVKAFEAQLTVVDLHNNHTMLSDPTTTNPTGVAYHSVEWSRPTTDPTTPGMVTARYYTAYSSGLASANDRLKVAATFVITEGFSGNAKVRAFAANPLYNIPATAASVSSGGSGYDLLTLDATFAANDFEIGAAFLDEFTLTWQVSEDNGTSWINVGVSTHDIYVLYKDPSGPLYHTVVHVGTIGAAGYVTDGGVIGGVWEEFTDLSVKKWNGGDDLVYSHQSEAALGRNPETTSELLIYGHAECSGWTDLLEDMLLVQGVTTTISKESIVSTEGTGFIVEHNWYWGTASTYDGAPFGSSGYFWEMDDNLNNFSGTDLLPQGNSQYGGSGLNIDISLGGYFPFHSVIVINGKIYDPSYGLFYGDYTDAEDNLAAWEADAVVGVYYKSWLGPIYAKPRTFFSHYVEFD